MQNSRESTYPDATLDPNALRQKRLRKSARTSFHDEPFFVYALIGAARGAFDEPKD